MTQLILHLHPESYLIGEMIQPELQIINTTRLPIEIGNGFIFDRNALAFSAPHAVHFIDPDGVDLAARYRGATPARHPASICVEPNNDAWIRLPVSLFFRLRKAGRYTLWLELADRSGQVYQSNQTIFSLVEIAPSIPPGQIRLNIETTKGAFQTNEAIEIEATFTNLSAETLVLLKPQEDSFDVNINPMFQFTVIDEKDRILPFPARSASMERPIYDETTMITLQPNEQWYVCMPLPRFVGLQRPGEYRINLSYIVADFRIGHQVSSLEGAPAPLRDLIFKGIIPSNELHIQVR